MKTLILALAAAGALMAQGVPLPYTKIQFFSNSGIPLASGQVCSYDSGTSTPRATFTDYTLTVNNPQCVVLDSAGRAAIWLDPSRSYRLILKDSGGSTIWTQDGVNAALGGSSGGGALWSLSGTTISNAVGDKVCVSASACAAALAQLNVAATTSGNTYPIRVDDTTSSTGISLYGAGAALGFYTANASGLQLRSADGTSQLSVAQGNVTVLNGASSGGSLLNIKKSATQGTVNPLQILTSTGSVLTYIDPDGVGFFPGLSASGTNTDIIQAVNGGVTAKWIIGTDSLFLVEEPAPAVSAAGQARIYADSTAHALYASINGGAYAPLGGGGGGSTTFDLIGTGSNVTATMTVGAGATLTFTSTGVVNASKINATTIPTSPDQDMILITTAAGVGAWSGAALNTTGLANCTDTGGNHLNYNTGTHQFSCGTSGGTVGSVSFGTITGATNSTAAMVVGTGASLGTSGTGSISATVINNGVLPSSGSIWKSNGSLQPVAAVAADIVATFSGGAGCSGTNLLAANGTCVSAGSGSFLPIAGGTMQGSIFINSPNNYDLGSAGVPWRNVYASQSGTFGTVSTSSGASLAGITSISPGATLRINNSSILEISTGGFIRPAADKGADLAGSSNRFNNGWVAGRLTIGDSSTGGGGFSTGSSTTSEIGTAGTLTMRPSSALQFTSTASITAPNGFVGVTQTLSCANINLTISAGIITSASCF